MNSTVKYQVRNSVAVYYFWFLSLPSLLTISKRRSNLRIFVALVLSPLSLLHSFTYIKCSILSFKDSTCPSNFRYHCLLTLCRHSCTFSSFFSFFFCSSHYNNGLSKKRVKSQILLSVLCLTQYPFDSPLFTLAFCQWLTQWYFLHPYFTGSKV